MAEWSIAMVLKTIDCYRSGGSNPSLSAKANQNAHIYYVERFFVLYFHKWLAPVRCKSSV